MTKLLFRVNNCHRLQFAGVSNIHDYYFNLLKVQNCGSSLTKCNISSPSYSDQQNILIKNTLQSLNLQNTLRVQNILRYKTTESSTASKDENPDAKEASKKINVTPLTKGDVKETSKDVTPLTRGDKLKKAVKEYGATVIVFHVGISLISLGTCYLLVTSGLDITKIFTAIGLEEWMNKSQIVTSAGTFAVAYAIHKVFAPVRIGITLTSVPLIVRYLRRIGFLKK